MDACNLGARAARGRYLVLLNNDMVVLPGWLEPLLETVEADPEVGAVGSMYLYPNGILQEAGSIIWRDGAGNALRLGAVARRQALQFRARGRLLLRRLVPHPQRAVRAARRPRPPLRARPTTKT